MYGQLWMLIIFCIFNILQVGSSPGQEVITLFSCSTQLSLKFELLLNIEIIKTDSKFKLR